MLFLLISGGAAKGMGIESDSEDMEEPEVLTTDSNGTNEQGGRQGAPKSSKKLTRLTTFKTAADYG